VILLDLDKEDSMRAISTNTFSIALPTKDTFDLRLSKPSSAILLVVSLLQVLSLSLEPRDYQWLVAKLFEVRRRQSKWIWYADVKTQARKLQSATLQTTTALFLQITAHGRNPDNILRLLVKSVQDALTGEQLPENLLRHVGTALNVVLAFVKENVCYKRDLVLSEIADIIRRIPEAERLGWLSEIRTAMPEILDLSQPSIPSIEGDNGPPPKKRPKMDNTAVTIDQLLSHILDGLNVERRASQDHTLQLSALISESWQAFNESQRLKLAEAVGLFGCSATGKLKRTIPNATNFEALKCTICDGSGGLAPSKQPLAFDLSRPLLSILLKRPSPSVTRAAIRSYARILMHDISDPILRIPVSPLADNILNFLNSKDRGQRIAAVQILPLLFTDRDIESLSDILSENRQAILRNIRKLQVSSARDKPLLETTVMAYGEIGKVATQADLSLVLTNLVDFLGHNNSFIAALAYREILAVAAAHGQSTWQMFSPFWSNISVKVVEQMRSRPQILARLADILEIRDSAFLTRTQNFTVPALVAGGHREILMQMSDKMGVQVWEMLKTNMPYVLAVLFTQERGRTETGVEFMVNLMAGNKKVQTGKPLIDTRTLIFSSRTPLTIELLKMLATESDAKRERVFMALQTVAAYVTERSVGEAGGSKGQEILKLYLQNNVLELMNHFTDIITDKKGRKTFTEKIGCIAGIQEIVRSASVASKAALPQVVPLKSRLT